MKRREFDIFGVLVGLVIGCILGFFLSTRINLEMPDGSNNDDQVLAQVGNIYLLQIDKVTSPTIAEDTLKSIKSKSLFAVAVSQGNNYYIYGGIADTEAELQITKEAFTTNGFTTVIKKEYILDKPNSVIEDQVEFKFYTECIDNLVSSLKGEELEISTETKTNPCNLELFSAILTMDTIENETLLKDVRLSIYEMIIEGLE